MRDQRISLEDIATLAGVTKMTVSRYLRAPHQVARKTADRIASVIKEINYFPDQRTLNQRHYILGVLVPSFQNLLFSDLLAGVESVTTQDNYQVLIANYNYFQASEEKQVIHLLSCHVQGMILCEKHHSLRTLKYLRNANIPLVEVMDIQGDKLDMQVGLNNQQAAFDMVNLMLKKRLRKKIVYMGSKDDSRDKQRFAGYCAALQAACLPVWGINPQSISSVSLGMQLMQEALRQCPDMDGVLCSNDDLALGALLCCQQLHIAVPRQISIVGFHGLEIGQQPHLRLASVITPRFDIGQIAARMLLHKIDNNTMIAESVDLGYQLYEGDTL